MRKRRWRWSHTRLESCVPDRPGRPVFLALALTSAPPGP